MLFEEGLQDTSSEKEDNSEDSRQLLYPRSITDDQDPSYQTVSYIRS